MFMNVLDALSSAISSVRFSLELRMFVLTLTIFFWASLPNVCGGFSADKNTFAEVTWEDVGRNLLKLRSVGVPDEVLMMTRLQIPDMKKVQVGESQVPGAGRGLFAARDIEKGELVTCYPGDILLQPNGLIGVPDSLVEDEKLLHSLLFKYSVGSIREGIAIMALPEKSDDMGYAGHLINDGAKAPTCQSELEKYTNESDSLANCEHMPLEGIHMVSLATRDIKSGEELFVSYGPVYWMDHVETWRGTDDDADFS